MSEKLPLSREHHAPHHEHESRQHEALKKSIEDAKAARHEHADNIDNIRAKAEIAASRTENNLEIATKAPENEKKHNTFVNRELKSIAYLRTMSRVRRQLPAPSRAFSKIIHQPVVESVSEVAGKTVARPSGVLAGGIAAFIGSSIFLWIARHYGYEYNFLLFALLFVGGFFIGLLVELVVRSLRKKET